MAILTQKGLITSLHGVKGPTGLYTQTSSSPDWEKATAYTDDTVANAAAESAEEALAAAGEVRDIAEKTANYFFSDKDGAHIASVEGNANVGGNTLIDSQGLVIREDNRILAQFRAAAIDLGLDSAAAEIRLCGGAGSIEQRKIASVGNTALAINSDDGILIGANVPVDLDSNFTEPCAYADARMVTVKDPHGIERRLPSFELSACYDRGIKSLVSLTPEILHSEARYFELNGDVEHDATVSINSKNLADWVMEKSANINSNSGWVWEKWAHGKAVFWKTITIETTIDTAWGSGFISTPISFGAFPFEHPFLSLPCAVITCTGSEQAIPMHTNMTRGNAGTVTLFRPEIYSTKTKFSISGHFIEYWKTIE